MSVFLTVGKATGSLLPLSWLLIGALTVAVGALVGLCPGDRYFHITNPVRTVSVCRRFGISHFRALMLHGDKMNAAIRRRDPGYRVVCSSAGSLSAYMSRTRDMERVHLACLLASIPIFVLAYLAREPVMAGAIVLLTLGTNLAPITLQRFNRARCILALQRLTTSRPNQALEPIPTARPSHLEH